MISSEQCWAMNRDGTRCAEPAEAECRFCKSHGRGGGPSPLWIWSPARSATSGGAPPEASSLPTAASTLTAAGSVALTIAEIALDDIVTDLETQRPPDWALIESMTRHGLLQPLDLRSRKDGRYDLVDGSRRLVAAHSLGWSTVTAVVEPGGRAGPAKELKAILLNTHRQNLRQLHLARHAQRHLRASACSQAELAREIRWGKSTLSMTLKVLDCPDLEAALERGELVLSAARALAPLLPRERSALVAEVEEWTFRNGKPPSVRQVKALVARRRDHAPSLELEPAELAATVAELLDRGVPIDIRVICARKSRVEVRLALTEADQAALRDRRGGESAQALPASEGHGALDSAPTGRA